MTPRKLVSGWIRQTPDSRDRLLRDVLQPTCQVANLPKVVDLRSTGHLPPVYEQGQLGSCTANAIAAALQYDQSKQGLPSVMPSRLFIYYNERVLEGTVGEDAGAQIRDGMKTLDNSGYPPEAHWPYIESKFRDAPPSNIVQEAVRNVTHEYLAVKQEPDDIRSALFEGFPIVFGFTCYQSLESQDVARTGLLPMPNWFDRQIGGHAVLMVGYDDNKQLFTIRNSWGPEWGDRGYFYMPYQYALSPQLACDFWVVRHVVG